MEQFLAVNSLEWLFTLAFRKLYKKFTMPRVFYKACIYKRGASNEAFIIADYALVCSWVRSIGADIFSCVALYSSGVRGGWQSYFLFDCGAVWHRDFLFAGDCFAGER